MGGKRTLHPFVILRDGFAAALPIPRCFVFRHPSVDARGSLACGNLSKLSVERAEPLEAHLGAGQARQQGPVYDRL